MSIQFDGSGLNFEQSIYAIGSRLDYVQTCRRVQAIIKRDYAKHPNFTMVMHGIDQLVAVYEQERKRITWELLNSMSITKDEE